MHQATTHMLQSRSLAVLAFPGRWHPRRSLWLLLCAQMDFQSWLGASRFYTPHNKTPSKNFFCAVNTTIFLYLYTCEHYMFQTYSQVILRTIKQWRKITFKIATLTWQLFYRSGTSCSFYVTRPTCQITMCISTGTNKLMVIWRTNKTHCVWIYCLLQLVLQECCSLLSSCLYWNAYDTYF